MAYSEIVKFVIACPRCEQSYGVAITDDVLSDEPISCQQCKKVIVTVGELRLMCKFQSHAMDGIMRPSIAEAIIRQPDTMGMTHR